MDKIISTYAIPGIARLDKELINIEFIQKKLCEIYGITLEKLQGYRRDAELVYVRHLYFYWVRKHYPGITFKTLGENLGGRDHTTVMYSVNTFQDKLDTDQELYYKINRPYKTVRMDYHSTSKYLISCL